uniref:Uncharacterized protein n=1 Tax=Arundo donax TaxID=35708 RepID=A0A0A9E5E2_ARUDO
MRIRTFYLIASC